MTSFAGNSGSAEIIDLRSDFLSRATQPMLAAMAEAATEACGFRPGEHPRERALEERAAQILGCEAALFCVTCAQANQIAIHLHCRPGEAILAERSSHVVTSEAGAAAVVSGAMITGIAGRRGILDPADVAAAIVPGDIQTPRTALVLMENTHVRSGGTVTPLETMRQIGAVARDRNLPVHLDGSRLFNAAAYLGVPVQALAGCADSVAVSLNKGLAAPQGAILAGGGGFIDRARRVRQIMGGGWRPAPALSAAALVALETMPQRLHEDHENAARLASRLVGCPGLAVAEGGPQTNLVLVDLVDPTLRMPALTAALGAHNVRVLPFGERRIRLAVYHNLGAAEMDRTADILLSIATEGQGTRK